MLGSQDFHDIALDPDAVDSEGHQLPQPTISTARINGSYLVTGTEGWEDFTDPTQNSNAGSGSPVTPFANHCAGG